MPNVETTETFDAWLTALRDRRGRTAIAQRVARLAAGNPGDIKPVGDRVSELRIDVGPGYRLYFTRRGGQLIVLLCGGDKSSQSRDIARAKALERDLECP